MYINVYLYETGGEEYGLDTMWHLLNSNIYTCVTRVVFLSCACVWILKIIMCIHKNVRAWQHLASVLPKQATQWANTKRVGGQWTRKEQMLNKVDKVRFGIYFQSIAKMPKCQEVNVCSGNPITSKSDSGGSGGTILGTKSLRSLLWLLISMAYSFCLKL